MKVKIFDKLLIKDFLEKISIIATLLSLILIFVDIPDGWKLIAGGMLFLILFAAYAWLWYKSNNLKSVDLSIEGSKVSIKAGDIFQQPGFKVIAFNEYFDTLVDDKIISSQSLNGIFIKQHLDVTVTDLDKHIEGYPFEADEILGKNANRKSGKKDKFSIGTICVYNDYILAAFSKFDESNRAQLTMPEYLGFLISFWDRVNRVYAQKSVSVPIFGSGITRIKEHKNISDEDLLKIMLWTFRISEMRFKYPAKLTILIHADKMDEINLLDIKSAKKGL